MNGLYLDKMNRDKEQESVPKKAKLSVPSISDINQAQKISSSRIELSVFKKSTTQLQAQDSDSIVKQTLQLPPSSTEQPGVRHAAKYSALAFRYCVT